MNLIKTVLGIRSTSSTSGSSRQMIHLHHQY